MKRIFAIALIFGAFITLLGLGTWQMQRLAWKEGLIAEAETRPSLPAVPLPELVDQGTEDLAYRRALLVGRFIGEPVRVFTTLSDPNGPYEGPGYWLMQPFVLAADNITVFINRGFIPFDLLPDAIVRPAPSGTVRFEGLVRPDDPPDYFTPDPDLEEGILYRRSVDQLMQAAGVSDALPITVDMPASAAGGLPQAGETKFTFSNRHFEYMLTWYGLAAVLLAVVGTILVQRRRG
ncbi:MAG: SURF1 family protein [Rhizobiales bacterium]|nr:SURF1 family protein [Hyphomicrobiales bacterium]MBO6699155.1 SURF1 family protein [Hyphomicrobiales bacterium]MBO6736693.1 SURF1 family protein [Hyphomicrobiales bacterium]MBO6912233.1 SURF1 family protein [Hyphomicrobiales bacterium]MBO6956236.1 SURF1 family protein [Hyphomicrobiales bacterium]